MRARRPFKPAVALFLSAVALALPQVAMAHFDNYPPHLQALTRALAPRANLSAGPGRGGFDWGDAGIGAAAAVVASALVLTSSRSVARRRGGRRARPATGV